MTVRFRSWGLEFNFDKTSKDHVLDIFGIQYTLGFDAIRTCIEGEHQYGIVLYVIIDFLLYGGTVVFTRHTLHQFGFPFVEEISQESPM